MVALGREMMTFLPFFVRNLAKRVNPVSDHADHEVITTDYLILSEGLRPERTSPSPWTARQGPEQTQCPSTPAGDEG